MWEMSFAQMPENRWRIATERVKWNTQYQKKNGIMTDAAKLDDAGGRVTSSGSPSAPIARSISTAMPASISAWTTTGRVYVLEANPNPNLAYGEDFAESAEVNGVSYERLLERIITLGTPLGARADRDDGLVSAERDSRARARRARQRGEPERGIVALVENVLDARVEAHARMHAV